MLHSCVGQVVVHFDLFNLWHIHCTVLHSFLSYTIIIVYLSYYTYLPLYSNILRVGKHIHYKL
jgi:hypothetical protein